MWDEWRGCPAKGGRNLETCPADSLTDVDREGKGIEHLGVVLGDKSYN